MPGRLPCGRKRNRFELARGRNLSGRGVRVGLDLRPLTAAPYTGMGRQALALFDTVRQRPDTQAVPFTSGPLTHPHRTWACCPAEPTPVAALWQPWPRYRFERAFLPDAISALAVDVHVATAGMGLPIGLSDVRRRRTRWVLQTPDVHMGAWRATFRHGWRDRLLRWATQWSVTHAMTLADAIWVPSAHAAQVLEDGLPQVRSRLRVLHDAVPVEAWQRLQQEVFAPPRYWLVVGAAHPRKNVPWFIDAWLRARRQWPALIPALVVIGHPRDLPSVPEGVRFVHGINDAQLSSWYRQAERLWHPACAESFALPVIEAAACGTPVATPQGGVFDEITPPGALRFDPRDTQAMLALMQQAAVLGREAAGPTCATADSLHRWAGQYDLPAYASRVDALLTELA